MEILFALTILSGIYLFPYVVAVLRDLGNRRSILLVNLFLGWTVIGWIVAFIQAVKTTGPDRTVRVQRLIPEKQCPICAEDNRRDAITCTHCGNVIGGDGVAEFPR
jgi:hypothetical protein